MAVDSSGLVQGGMSVANSLNQVGGMLAKINASDLAQNAQLKKISMEKDMAEMQLAQKQFDFAKASHDQEFALKQRAQLEDTRQFNLQYSRLKDQADQMLKEKQLEYQMSFNRPASKEGQLAQDEARGLVPEGTFAKSQATAVGGKAPPGYRFTNPQDINSPLEAIPGGPATKMTPQNAAAASALTEAARDFKDAKGMLFDKDGGVNRSLLITSSAVPGVRGVPGTKGRQFRQTITRAIFSKLRLETGAAVAPEEMKKYEEMFVPTPLDSEASIKQKLESLGNFLDTTGSKIEGYQPVNEKKSEKPIDIAKSLITPENIAFTAKKKGITEDEVVAQLKAAGKM